MPAEDHIPPQYMNLNLRDVIVTFCPSVNHSQVVRTQKVYIQVIARLKLRFRCYIICKQALESYQNFKTKFLLVSEVCV